MTRQIQNALVLGAGRSGTAVERLLAAEGCTYTTLDESRCDGSAVDAALHNHPVEICLVSPGFPFSHPWLEKVRAAGINLLSELELGWSRHAGKVIAVTGSNGKSTAVKLIHEALSRAGYSAVPGGNCGPPASEVVMEQPPADWLVLEASSFQLECVHAFSPDISVMLNLLPNHLDRHGSMEAYGALKARVFGPAGQPADICIVPFSECRRFSAWTEGERNWITFGTEPEADYRFSDGQVWHGETLVLDLRETPFGNTLHGACTGAAIAAVAAECGWERTAVEAAAKAFEGLSHRFERLGTVNGVEFINDSKATNLAAMAAAVAACAGKVHLIAGGHSKESDYSFVKEALAQHAEGLYIFGESAWEMQAAWEMVCPCRVFGTLDEAFECAKHSAKRGCVVLLSPGCASFDQFFGFEERGDRFAGLVGQHLRETYQ